MGNVIALPVAYVGGALTVQYGSTFDIDNLGKKSYVSVWSVEK